MFTMGLVHTRDHGPECFVASARNLPRGAGRGRVLLYAHSGRSNRGASTHRGTPEGSQIDSKF